ncbi:c-type cytochrome biogenesis protein CcsB, partial [Corynebacterium sanguinis]|nr:c-type cytochrome biogenesis protein CcsB [Corynebacterium sanguinis]
AGWRDHKAAWINILALATIIFNLFFINLVVSGLHSYAGLN